MLCTQSVILKKGKIRLVLSSKLMCELNKGIKHSSFLPKVLQYPLTRVCAAQ